MTLQLTIALSVEDQNDGQSLCQMTIASGEQSEEPRRFHGQNPDHAIAVALEDLAARYREAAATQGIDYMAVERSPSGEAIEKRYHVILHYERVAEDESKFEAMHNTIMGNTVVENATIEVIEIDRSLPLDPRVLPY